MRAVLPAAGKLPRAVARGSVPNQVRLMPASLPAPSGRLAELAGAQGSGPQVPARDGHDHQTHQQQRPFPERRNFSGDWNGIRYKGRADVLWTAHQHDTRAGSGTSPRPSHKHVAGTRCWNQRDRGSRGVHGAADNAANGLFSVSIDGRDRRRVAAGTFANMQPTADRRTIYFRGAAPAAGGRGGGAVATQVGFSIERLTIGAGNAAPAAGRAGGAGEEVAFAFNVKVDRKKEWQQIFDESYRVMKYRYYDPKMHGKDWAAIKAKYEPLLKYAGTNEDVYDIANAAIGELSSSHTGVSGPASIPIDRTYNTRYLGVELEPSGDKYRVSHVYRDGPADKEWIDIKRGDYVLAIDGVDVKAGDDYWKILSESEAEYVPVKTSKTADGANAKTVRLQSSTNLTTIKYEEWVQNNRDSVDKATDNQIAYVHIKAMDQPSLERFQNEIDQFWQKKGIIVDIRNNGGGNIDQELLDILERQPYQFWNNRTGARTWGRRPRQAIVGPKVMMVNYRSVSDAEVTPAGFRQLGLGRIVGNPTAAQVIATGSYPLINGGAIRTPGSLVVSWDPTKPNNYGFDLENFGVPPDVWIKNSPADEAKGMDKELRVAIEEAMRLLKAPSSPTKVQP